jgi:hypothetical protein
VGDAAFDGGDLTAAGMGRSVKKEIQRLTRNPNWMAQLGSGDVVKKERVEKGVPQSLPLLLLSKEKTEVEVEHVISVVFDIIMCRYLSFRGPWVSLPKTSQSLIP